ncbi:MAG: hypothetical protein JO270_21170 [Acidobacteriaceae bacterium]|nr:hypothetical protein [Acidobacteriaceae bacterium]
MADATKKVTPDALSSEDRQRIVEGLIDVVRPTLDQIREFSPNMQRVVYAARGTGGGVKRSAAKKAAPKKATAKRAAKKFEVARASAQRDMGSNCPRRRVHLFLLDDLPV